MSSLFCRVFDVNFEGLSCFQKHDIDDSFLTFDRLTIRSWHRDVGPPGDVGGLSLSSCGLRTLSCHAHYPARWMCGSGMDPLAAGFSGGGDRSWDRRRMRLWSIVWRQRGGDK